jgi:hypothetical protein
MKLDGTTKLAAFGVALGAVLVTGLGLGAAVGSAPGDDPAPAHGDGGHGETDAPPTAADVALPGLAISAQGYTLQLDDTVLDDTVLAGREDDFRFRILGADGAPVQRFDVEHDKELHLVVVSRDLQRYQHVHPSRAADGTWSVDLAPLGAGPARVFADFRATGGPALTLGADVIVPGTYEPPPPPDESRRLEVDGFDVDLVGALHGGDESPVEVRVSRDGAPVAVEPYLGADGHLVAVRAGDLAYLHVHPTDDGDGQEGTVTFLVETPSNGRYRLFFDFQVDGVVHTADFTIDAAMLDEES